MTTDTTTSATASEGLRQRFATSLMPTYGTPPVAIERGEGCRVVDVDGGAYLDLIAGIAVSALGHAHPALVDAVSHQVAQLAHTSNLFLHRPEVELAERLLGLLDGDGRVFFANSGAEANETALKMVRKTAAEAGRTYFIATENGFHGRTAGALALTGKASIREPFGPFGMDVRYVPFGDVAALRSAVTPRCAGVFVEPLQGEGGVVPAPAGYLRGVREACDATGTPLVIDEIQSGIGRTGHWFAHQQDGVRPDVLTVAKGLGGGLPIGACVGIGAYGQTLVKGDHGATFGGNPVACAAALAVLDTIERDELLAQVKTVGRRLAADIGELRHPLLQGVRGSGLWLGLVLTRPLAGAVETASREAGFLVNAVRPDVIRIAPPLVITADEARSFVDALPAILDKAASETTDAAAEEG